MDFNIPVKTRFLIYLPVKLQYEVSNFLKDKLRLSDPVLCSDFDTLEKIWKEDPTIIIIAAYYRRTTVVYKLNQLIEDKSANIIMVNSKIDLANRDWSRRFHKAINFFDDVSRPVCTIALIGITYSEYIGSPIASNEHQCYLATTPVNRNDKIKSGFIYSYRLNSEDEFSFARFFDTGKEGHYRLEPDMRLAKRPNENKPTIESVSRNKINFSLRVVYEYWRF